MLGDVFLTQGQEMHLHAWNILSLDGSVHNITVPSQVFQSASACLVHSAVHQVSLVDH